MTQLAADPRAGRRPAPTHGPRPAHPCPGQCGHQVPAEVIACRRCWYTLPARLRVAIRTVCQRTPPGRRTTLARLVAVAAAHYWFHTHKASRG